MTDRKDLNWWPDLHKAGTVSRSRMMFDWMRGARPKVFGVDPASPDGDMGAEVSGYRRPDGTIVITKIVHSPTT